MSDFELQNINANDTGVISFESNGKTYVYWLNLYQRAGLTQPHAVKVLDKLTEEKHYIKFTRSEIKEILTGNAIMALLPAVKSYVFVNAEGWNRAIMEIETTRLKDEVAEGFEELKDDMANIYTRYQQGEVLSIASETHAPVLPGFVPAAVVVEDYVKQAEIFSKGSGIPFDLVMSSCLARAELDLQKLGHDGNLSHLSSHLSRSAALPEPAIYNATNIGTELGLTARSVNNILERFGYQTAVFLTSKTGTQSKRWIPTEKGKLFGEYKPFSKGYESGTVHSEYLWYWRDSIIQELRNILFTERIGQQQLPITA